MINDIALRVSTAQAVTTTAVSVDSVDLQNARDIGEGQGFYAVFTVGTGFSGGTSIQFEIIVADNGALTTNPTVIAASAVIPVASLGAGRQIVVSINEPLNPIDAVPTARRFLGARYTVAGTMSAGTVTADMVLDYQGARRAYPSGFAVV
jgi:hypothetical protein